MKRLRSRLPAPLCALLACIAVVGCTWAVVTPPWQAPDETAHVAYVQGLAERGSLPGGDRPMMSTEQATAATAANAFQVAGVLLSDPEWSPRVAAELRDQRLARDDGGGPNPAGTNPPLYYLYETIAYRAGGGGDIWQRMLAMRLASVFWLLVTVVGAWLLAGQLFRRDRRMQLVAAGFTGLLPMMTFISSSVTPDAMMIALWTLTLWLGVATLREQDWRTGVALGLVAALAVVTKSTSYALVLPVLLVLVVAAQRTRAARSTAAAVRGLLAALAALAVPVLAWLVVARLSDYAATSQIAGTAASPAGANNLREFLSYVWQFYLPKLPFQADYEELHPAFQSAWDGLPLYMTWIKTGWAAFGYLEVRFPDPVYWVLAAASALIALAFLGSLRGRLRRLDWASAAFLFSVVILLLGGLHWTEYQTIQNGGPGFMQGRYLLPVAALGGIAAAQATRVVPTGGRLAVQASILGCLVVLQLYALALVMTRYFA